MFRHLITLTLAFCSYTANASWQFSNDVWLGKTFYSMVKASSDGQAKLYLSSTDTESITLKLSLPQSSIARDKNSIPFSLKGVIFFDGQKYQLFSLKNDLNVHRFQGVEYAFPDYLFDADFYDKIKTSKTIQFVYQGLDDKAAVDSEAPSSKEYKINFLLDDYYKHFNQFVTYRMKMFIPEFLEGQQKRRYSDMIDGCISYASEQVLDIKAKNNGVSLESQLKRIRKAKDPDKDSQISRVIASYEYLADTSQPEWLLYSLFSNCYNRQVYQFN